MERAIKFKNEKWTIQTVKHWKLQKLIFELVFESMIESKTSSIIDFLKCSKIEFLNLWIFHFWKIPGSKISFFIFIFEIRGLLFFIFHFWNLWLAGWQSGWRAGWFALLTGWLAGWLTGCLALCFLSGLLAGWLVDFLDYGVTNAWRNSKIFIFRFDGEEKY